MPAAASQTVGIAETTGVAVIVLATSMKSSIMLALARSTVLGMSGVFLAAIPVIGAFALSTANAVPTSWYVVFKGVWAGLLALVVSRVVAYWSIIEATKGCGFGGFSRI